MCDKVIAFVVAKDVAELLLGVGADPNALDSEGNTPLYLLANNKFWDKVLAINISAARILIKYGACFDQKNRVTLKTARQLYKEKIEI